MNNLIVNENIFLIVCFVVLPGSRLPTYLGTAWVERATGATSRGVLQRTTIQNVQK